MRKSALSRVVLLVGLVFLNQKSDAEPREDNKALKKSQETNTIPIPELSPYYFCLLNRGPNWTDEESPEHQRLQAEHLEYLLELAQTGRVVVLGPFADADDSRGIAVFRVNSLEEAKALGAADPKVKAGHLQLKWYTWLVPEGQLPAVSMLGKTETGRELRFDATLDIPVAAAFELWSTSKGAKKFFARDAKIDPSVGGRYEIIFDPENDPQGKQAGTYGAKLLRYDKGRSLAFEWTMPPFVAELNAQPLPTWIEVEFESAGNKTRVSIIHYGFGTSEQWDRAYDWFQTEAWPSVIARLNQYCNEKIDPWSAAPNED